MSLSQLLLLYLLLTVHSAPDDIYLADARKDELLFSWTHVASSGCFSPTYNISSDCGTCTITNVTMATCSDLQVTTDASVCHFGVNSVVCDQAGNPSSPVAVILKGTKKGNFYCCHAVI